MWGFPSSPAKGGIENIHPTGSIFPITGPESQRRDTVTIEAWQRLNRYYRQGWTKRTEKVALCNNPYRADTTEFSQWVLGWLDREEVLAQDKASYAMSYA